MSAQYIDFAKFAAFIRRHGSLPTQTAPGTKAPWYDFLAPKNQTAQFLDSINWRTSYSVGYVCDVWQDFDYDHCPDYAPVARSLAAMELAIDYRWVIRSGSGNGYRIVFVYQGELITLWGDKGKVSRPSIDGSFHHVEYRRHDHQSILAGQHPTGPGYSFANGKPSAPPTVLTAEQVIAGFSAVAQFEPAMQIVKTSHHANISRRYTLSEFAKRKCEQWVDEDIRKVETCQFGKNDAGVNDLLNSRAYYIGRVVGAGGYDEQAAYERLLNAVRANGYIERDGLTAAERTLRSGFYDGIANPRQDLHRYA